MNDEETALKSDNSVKDFISGGSAAAFNIIVTFPPNKLMFRQQLYGVTMREAYKGMKSEGLRTLYRGVKPPLFQAALSKSLMFGLFGCYDRLLPQVIGRDFYGQHQMAAFLSGTTEAVLTPLERVQTLLQIPKYNTKFSGAVDAFVHVNRHGVREHFRGLSAILIRNGSSNVFFFGLREPIRNAIVRNTDEPSSTTKLLADFISGAVLGACLSTLFFPLNVAKSRMQSIYGEEFISIREALRIVYAERGYSIRHMYRGVHINFTRSLVSWGIINSTYEHLKTSF